MDVDELTVTIPHSPQSGYGEETVRLWPLVQAALGKINPPDVVHAAARSALLSGRGCIVLANYLNGAAKGMDRMDYRFKVPLLVRTAREARRERAAEVIFDPEEGALYFETPAHQYSFHLFTGWSVDWEALADRVEANHLWQGVEEQRLALVRLLTFYDETAPTPEDE